MVLYQSIWLVKGKIEGSAARRLLLQSSCGWIWNHRHSRDWIGNMGHQYTYNVHVCTTIINWQIDIVQIVNMNTKAAYLQSNLFEAHVGGFKSSWNRHCILKVHYIWKIIRSDINKFKYLRKAGFDRFNFFYTRSFLVDFINIWRFNF